MINDILMYVFGAAAAASALGGWSSRVRRMPLFLAAGCFSASATAAHFDHFWPLASFGILGLWSAFTASTLVDFGWRLRAGLVAAVTAFGLLVLWPSASKLSGGKLPCPTWVQERIGSRLVAGLDLRGGLRLVYTVEVAEAVKDKRDHYYDQMRVSLAKSFGLHSGDERPNEEVFAKLREKVEMEAPRARPDTIFLKFKEAADVEKVDARFRDEFRGDFGDPEVKGQLVTYKVKQSTESDIRERAVAQAKEIILRRVDELGLREASVSTRDEDVIVEVPGEDESSFAQIRDIISQTARLEFKLLDDDSTFMETVQRAATPENLPEGLSFQREVAPIGKDASGERQVREVTFAYLKLKDGEAAKDGLVRAREWAATLTLPPDRELGFSLQRRTDPDTLEEHDDGWRSYLLKSRAEITGDMVRDAVATPDQSGTSMGGWHVSLAFTDQGGRIFDRVTEANVKRRFAIILDNKVESAPEIIQRISGGNASISMGSRDPAEQLRDARKLELVLRSGALPAPISPSNEQRIGPSLGRDAIQLGIQGALGGAGLVILFMLVYFQRAGLIANLAVGLNLLLQLAILASFGASMTLPGIAGLALTVGMSVDGNVLINERIREELKAGKSTRVAVDLGYDKALSAIVDGHLTTLISGIVMAQYGTGPVKGFAVTLMVGVVCGVFTSVMVSRVMFDLWLSYLGRNRKLDMG